MRPPAIHEAFVALAAAGLLAAAPFAAADPPPPPASVASAEPQPPVPPPLAAQTPGQAPDDSTAVHQQSATRRADLSPIERRLVVGVTLERALAFRIASSDGVPWPQPARLSQGLEPLGSIGVVTLERALAFRIQSPDGALWPQPPPTPQRPR